MVNVVDYDATLKQLLPTGPIRCPERASFYTRVLSRAPRVPRPVYGQFT
jgi:hypothetical protein